MFDLDVVPAGLPIGATVDELAAALTVPGARVVVSAPPGSGKTTVVPAVAATVREGRVVVTQPRRIAARAAANRLAELSSSRLGGRVGVTVRGESRTGRETAVEFMTAGVLVNRLLGDPDLSGVGTVVLDEVHERDLETGLGFAMVQEVAALREDLGLVVMSATLDASRWMELLGPEAVLIEVDGVLHDLDVEWAPAPSGVVPTHRGHLSRDFADHLVQVVGSVCGRRSGSVLVFVPTRRDVAELSRAIRLPGMTTVGLSGALDARGQDEVLRGDGRRVVVATSVAESSLTVPGVDAVVDSGLAREPRFDAGRGMNGLVTIRESKASAVQRAGRAARTGPGLAVRCFPATDWAGMAPEATPQCQVADLGGVVLRLAAWGATRGEGMSFPDPLPSSGVDRGVGMLHGLGALDDAERITAFGRRLARIPVEPRAGRALLVGAEAVGARAAAEVVAMLSGDLRCDDGDLGRLLRELRAGRAVGAATWRREARRLAGLVGEAGFPGGTGEPSGVRRVGRTKETVDPGAVADTDPVGLVTAFARPDWIARRRDDGAGFLTASGTGVQVEPGSALGRATWLAVAELNRVEAGAHNTSGALVRAGVEIDEQTALEAGAGLLREVDDLSWHRESGTVRGRRERRLGAILLVSTPVTVAPHACQDFLLTELRRQGLGIHSPGLLDWSAAALQLRDRLGFAHRAIGEPWPDVSESALVDSAAQWLGPHLGGSTRQVDLVAALRGLLDWRQLACLDEVVPERLVVPTGSMIRVRYPEIGSDRAPVLAVKLQECFGMTTTPRVCGIPVLMELLSPARRPLAVTDDLASFWTNVYPRVRAENRGRYAKHPWPEDPLSAVAQRGTKKSGI